MEGHVLGDIELLVFGSFPHKFPHLVDDAHFAGPDAFDGLVLVLEGNFALVFSRTLHAQLHNYYLLCLQSSKIIVNTLWVSLCYELSW